MTNTVRTDLASEAFTSAKGKSGALDALDGVKAENETLDGLPVLAVEISNDKGAEALNKPIGKYYTLTLSGQVYRGADAFPTAAGVLAQLISRCVNFSKDSVVLIAALGNPDITPDAVGPIAASNILVTRHMKGRLKDFDDFGSVALCRTGVLGTTGIESAAHILSVASVVKPDCIIAVDALAGSDTESLCKCVQISDAGIAPGSGVGNDRQQLDSETLGVPVIAVGVPTVIDAAQFSDDENVRGMFVTPRNIDSSVRNLGRLIGYAINLAAHKGITVEDIDMLVG